VDANRCIIYISIVLVSKAYKNTSIHSSNTRVLIEPTYNNLNRSYIDRTLGLKYILPKNIIYKVIEYEIGGFIMSLRSNTIISIRVLTKRELTLVKEF